MPVPVMQQKIDRFRAELPALPALIERITSAAESTGYLIAVDGRWGRIRSSDGNLLVHTMLNVLLQMTGSLAMKYSLAFAERQMLKEQVGLDEFGFPAWVANVHDEMQAEINADEVKWKDYLCKSWKEEEKRIYVDAQGRMWSAPIPVKVNEDGSAYVKRAYHRLGQIICEQMTHAGVFLKMRCPLAGEYKIGKSWHDTH